MKAVDDLELKNTPGTSGLLCEAKEQPTQPPPWARGDRLLNPKEVSRILGLGRSKVYEMIARRELPVVQIGTAVRVPSLKLQRWIEERTEQAA